MAIATHEADDQRVNAPARLLPLGQDPGRNLRELVALNPDDAVRRHAQGGLLPMLRSVRDAATLLESRLPSDWPQLAFAGGTVEASINHMAYELRRHAALAPNATAEQIADVTNGLCAQAARFVEAAFPWLQNDVPALTRQVANLQEHVSEVRASALRSATEAVAEQRELLETLRTEFADRIRKLTEEATNTHHEWAKEANQLRDALAHIHDRATETEGELQRTLEAAREAANADERDRSERQARSAASIVQTQKELAEKVEVFDVDARAALGRATTEVQQLIGDAKAGAAKIVSDALQAEAVTAAIAQASFFTALAEKHEKEAVVWLKATAATALAVVLGLGALAYFPRFPLKHDPQGAFDVARYFSLRAFLALAGSFLLTIFVRNYRANQHNAVVNRHRQKALETFQKFAMATPDPRIRDALLMQASTAVFTVHPSGYLATGEDMVLTQGTIIDAMKLATGAAPAPAPAQPPR